MASDRVAARGELADAVRRHETGCPDPVGDDEELAV
jgi:hypothetical protein